MFCKNCGSPVGDNDLVCRNCGTLTEYGEKVSRHEALPPVGYGPAVGGNGFNPIPGYPQGGYPLNNGNPQAQPGQTPNGAAYPPAGGQSPVNPDGSLNPDYRPPAGTQDPNKGYYYAPQNVSPVPDMPKGSNGMAVAGLVCAFLIPLLGLIFSIIGLKRSAQQRAGKGLSIAGIIVSVVMMIVYLW